MQKNMDDIKKQCKKAHKYLEEAGKESWSRAFFDDTSKCEHLNNNFSESFNAMIKNLRDKPVCKIGYLYNQLVRGLFYKRAKESATWDPEGLVPTAMTLIEKMLKLVGAFKVTPSVLGEVYEVVNRGSKAIFIVDLKAKTCTCLQWQLRGFVCQHSVCALKSFRPDWTE